MLRFPLGSSWFIAERRARKERAGRRKRWLLEPLYSVQLHASLTFDCIGVDQRGSRSEEESFWVQMGVSIRINILTIGPIDIINLIKLNFNSFSSTENFLEGKIVSYRKSLCLIISLVEIHYLILILFDTLNTRMRILISYLKSRNSDSESVSSD